MSESNPSIPPSDSDEAIKPKKVTKRRSPRQKLLVKMKVAAETGNLQTVLNHYLSLCILSINDSKAFADKMTPRTIIEVVEAITALKKLEAMNPSTTETDPEMAEFMKQMTSHTKKEKTL